MKRNIFLFIVIGLLCGALGIYLGLRQSPEQQPQTLGPAALFAQTMPDLQGHPQAFAQWKGKTILVNFWAPWCPPCVEEMPELSALHDEISPKKNIHIIGVGIDSAANIAAFSKKYKINYPLYIAGTDGVALLSRLGNSAGGLPFTLLIGPDGEIKRTYLGRLKFDQLRHDLAVR